MPVLKNAKHEAVALAYLADPEKIGWRAYQKVYPKSSQHASEVAFSRLLKNAEFASRVAETQKAAAVGAVMSAHEVLERLSNLARGDVEEKAYPVLRSLDLLGRHHALFTDRLIHDLGDKSARLVAALARVDGRKPHGKVRSDSDAPRAGDARKAARKSKRARPGRRSVPADADIPRAQRRGKQ
jgi:hypothetical protein